MKDTWPDDIIKSHTSLDSFGFGLNICNIYIYIISCKIFIFSKGYVIGLTVMIVTFVMSPFEMFWLSTTSNIFKTDDSIQNE